MNFEERSELFQKRRVEALVAMMGLKKTIKRFIAEFAAGRETDVTTLSSVIARCESKFMLRMALSYPIPVSEVLKTALADFNGQDDVPRDFIRDYGVALDRGIKRRMHDHLNNAILMLWDGFDMVSRPYQKEAATLPALSRWNGRAAWLLIKTMICEPGLMYETYRQRVSRLGLYQMKPILVKKMKIGPSTFGITFTPRGTQWLRENHLLGAVTRNGKKMSHDMETPARFNAANGSDKITIPRARTLRVRGGQRTPANNSPDLHPIARAAIALPLDRIQPKRAR